MGEKKDLRVIKTQQLLFDTLIYFMKDKTFEEIKVSDICAKALINRSTFYAHYNDKYELLLDFINHFKGNLLEALDKNKKIVNSKEYYIEMIKLLLDHIDDKRDIYYSILMNNRNSIIIDMLLDVASKDINKRIKEDDFGKGKIPVDILTKFYLGAVASIGSEWIKDKNKYSKEELINYLDTLIPDNIGK